MKQFLIATATLATIVCPAYAIDLQLDPAMPKAMQDCVYQQYVPDKDTGNGVWINHPALDAAIQKCATDIHRAEVEHVTGSPNFRVEELPNTLHMEEGPNSEPGWRDLHLRGHAASIILTNLGNAILVTNVVLNGRPECSMPVQETLIKTGDQLLVTPLCAATVSVSIETNRGTVNYQVQ